VIVERAHLVGALGPVGVCRILGVTEEGGEGLIVDDDERAHRLVAVAANLGDGDAAPDEVVLALPERLVILEGRRRTTSWRAGSACA